MAKAAKKGKKTKAVSGAKGDPGDPLLAALKKWRTARSKAQNLPAFVVLHDATLAAIAAQRPTTRAKLAEVPGIGEMKIARYGDELLEVVIAVNSDPA